MSYRVKNKVRVVLVALALALAIGSGLLWATGLTPFMTGGGFDDDTASAGDLVKGRMNVLLLGMDAREGETLARSDTIMLASVDTEKNQLSLLSIPRDTRVMIPGRGWEKLNAASLYGGPRLALKTVSDLTGIRIDKYVVTNYQGFEEIVDTLGGVTINVEKRMYHYDPQDGGIYTIDLKPGEQRLDGRKALQFVRYRGYELGDISRAEQQQRFLTALAKEVMQPGTVLKLPRLVPKIGGAVETNLTLAEMAKLARTAGTMSNTNLITQTMPGKFLDLNGASYWSVDPDEARLAVAKLLNGEKTLVVQGTTVIESTVQESAPGGKEAKPGAGGIVPVQEGGKTTTPGVPPDNQKVTPPKQGGNPVNGNSSSVTVKPGSGSTGSKQGAAQVSPGTGGEKTTGVEVKITPVGVSQPNQGGIVPGTVVPPPPTPPSSGTKS